MKTCITCKKNEVWFGNWSPVDICTYNYGSFIDPVTGKTYQMNSTPSWTARHDEQKCGMEAKYHEQKEN